MRKHEHAVLDADLNTTWHEVHRTGEYVVGRGDRSVHSPVNETGELPTALLADIDHWIKDLRAKSSVLTTKLSFFIAVKDFLEDEAAERKTALEAAQHEADLEVAQQLRDAYMSAARERGFRPRDRWGRVAAVARALFETGEGAK